LFPVIFNAIISWGILSLNYFFFKKEGFEKIGFFSSLCLATMGIFYGMSILVRMDTLFLFFAFLSIYFFWISYKEDNNYYLFFSSIFSFLAVFTKGAFGMIFPFFIEVGMGIVLKNKKFIARALLANLRTSIMIFIWLASFSQMRCDYLRTLFFKQTMSRGFNPYSHAEPFYYYFIYIFPVFLPWSFMVIGYFLNFKKSQIYPWEKLYLLWFLGGFVILSLVRSKIPMYLLLLSIPCSGLVGKFLCEGRDSLRRKLLILTGTFLPLSFLIAFLVFRKKGVIPPPAFLSIPLFLITPFLIIRKSPTIQFRNFFIFWLIVTLTLNFICIPAVSNASAFRKIIDTIKGTKVNFRKIYVTEESLVTLSIYSPKKPLIYLSKKKDICKKKGPFILVSKENNFLCPLKQISQIGKFYIFYRQK
jgi:4-amino-4-deoxy-L-arabinose transferase-like glycosyltransferase